MVQQAMAAEMTGRLMQVSPWHHMQGTASPRPLAGQLHPEGAPGTSRDTPDGSCHHTG